MLRLLTPLLLLCALAASAASNSLVWLETSHNFGAFNEDLDRVRCTFRAVNTDSVPVSVIASRANCGCTVPKYTREPIQPGDTLTVEVEYNAVGRPGRFAKKVFIDTSNGQKAVLNIRGTVVAAQNTLQSRYPVAVGKVHLSNRIAPLGTTVKGRMLYGGINIYNSTDHQIVPVVRDLPPYLKAVIEPGIVPVGESAFVSITAATDRIDAWGPYATTFTLFPDRKNAPADSAVIDVTMIINEDFSKLTPEEIAKAPQARLSTESVDFGHIAGDGPLTQTFTIANTGRSPLIIRRIDSAEKAISVSADPMRIGPGGSADVTVTLNPTLLSADTPLNARINLTLNVPEAPHAAVRVVGTR